MIGFTLPFLGNIHDKRKKAHFQPYAASEPECPRRDRERKSGLRQLAGMLSRA